VSKKWIIKRQNLRTYTQNYWSSGLCPSSRTLKNYKAQRLGNWICICPQVQWLRLASSKGPNRVGVSPLRLHLTTDSSMARSMATMVTGVIQVQHWCRFEPFTKAVSYFIGLNQLQSFLQTHFIFSFIGCVGMVVTGHWHRSHYVTSSMVNTVFRDVTPHDSWRSEVPDKCIATTVVTSNVSSMAFHITC
jgi:hypothetical protein